LSTSLRTAVSAMLLLAGCAAPAAPQAPARTPEGPPDSSGAPARTPGAQVERRIGVMGTTLSLRVAARNRAAALAASEVAVRALEAVEARLSTWRPGTELAQLNRAPVGASIELSPALAADLALARELWLATDGAFDPAIGGLVAAWSLRGAGRVPTPEERAAATSPHGFADLELTGLRAVRRDARVIVEEGGFGKGVGLDAALDALRATEATAAVLDLGGQIALFAAVTTDERSEIVVAHPDRRDEPVARLYVERGSVATSGNSERGLVVDGQHIGHVLDPRTGAPAPDFGSLTVWAVGAGAATVADALSTGLYVLGPDAALAFAERHPGVEVLVAERASDGLRIRASSGLDGRVHPPAPASVSSPLSLSRTP